MKKKVGIIKRALCIGLVFLFSINSFAAVVSDNDGGSSSWKLSNPNFTGTFRTGINTITPLSTSTLPTSSTSGLLISKEGVQSNGSMLCNQSQTATFNVAAGTMIYILAVKHEVKGGAILDLTQTTAKEYMK